MYNLLACNECLGFAALIILHVFRFREAGKVCSDRALFDRGEYLKGLVIAIWVMFGFGCFMAICLPIIIKKMLMP